MSECEVSIGVAMFLLRSGLVQGDVSVALDGAQVQTSGVAHFPIGAFLERTGWRQGESDHSWRGRYTHAEFKQSLVIHSNSGCGDVVARLTSGHSVRVESKKGPLTASKSSAEYPLIREALGQLLTIEETQEGDILAIAVPESPKFRALTERWRSAPLIQRVGIQLWTVDRDNNVSGVTLRAS